MTEYLDNIRDDFKKSFFSESIGLEINDVSEGNVKLVLPYRQSFENMQNTIHGGIYATILDTTMGLTCRTFDYDAAITIQMSIQFIRAVREEAIHSTATVISRNNKTMLVEGKLYDEQGYLVAHSTGTFKVVKDETTHDAD
ncbi:PaaI family thioesterase [Sporosarcina obsidiansis]|uniref:PaaI family thioesterase n=1 Tax=Sporosarcina obsidiansis TaxID=2660748 RepID=UPI00129AF268|nr:PaaI family thioesterase [Sporosarcina obsidiansis]